MESKIENISQVISSYSHLPIVHTLRKYNKADWICFGHLTHRYPTSPEKQADNFRRLMDTLGGVNHCFAKRLHWFCRIEGNGIDKNVHLHFLLGGHKVTNGHYHPFSVPEVCSFLEVNWPHGNHCIVPYNIEKAGVEYVTKITKPSEREDYYELSRALQSHFMKEIAA